MKRSSAQTGYSRATVIVVLFLSMASLSAGAYLLVSTRAAAMPSVHLSESLLTPLGPAELAASYGTAIYRVETSGCGLEGVGTAFAISDRHLVTNWHVVANDVRPTLRARDGSTITGRVIGWTEDPDIAVIETDARFEVALTWSDSGDLVEGMEVTSLGYPLPDHEFTVTPGTVLNLTKRGNRVTGIRTDASVDRGSSGGPGLTASGTVAGMVTEMDLNLQGFQYVAILVPYEALRGSLDSILAEPDRPKVDCDHPINYGDY